MRPAPAFALLATLFALYFAVVIAPQMSVHARLNRDVGELIAFEWREAAPADNFDHRGVILFISARGRVYSRAWPLKSRNNWPTVRGVGVWVDREIHIVYRSAASSPGHEFYHCDCHFTLSPDTRSFTCHAMQKASAADDAAMVPSYATGARLDIIDPAWRTQIEHVLAAARGTSDSSVTESEPLTVPAERCPVLGNVASERIGANYNGITYHFCCESCCAVFHGHPQAFTQNAK